jgi:hypothetical protein
MLDDQHRYWQWRPNVLESQEVIWAGSKSKRRGNRDGEGRVFLSVHLFIRTTSRAIEAKKGSKEEQHMYSQCMVGKRGGRTDSDSFCR